MCKVRGAEEGPDGEKKEVGGSSICPEKEKKGRRVAGEGIRERKASKREPKGSRTFQWQAKYFEFCRTIY